MLQKEINWFSTSYFVDVKIVANLWEVRNILSGRTTTQSGKICDHDTVENKFKAFTLPAEVMFSFAVKSLAAYPTSSKYSWAIKKTQFLSLTI